MSSGVACNKILQALEESGMAEAQIITVMNKETTGSE